MIQEYKGFFIMLGKPNYKVHWHLDIKMVDIILGQQNGKLQNIFAFYEVGYYVQE